MELDVIHVSGRIMYWIRRWQLRRDYRKQRDSRDSLISSQGTALWHVDLHIWRSIQVVQDAQEQVMYDSRISDLRMIVVSRAVSPFQDLFRISVEPDIQSTGQSQDLHLSFFEEQVTNMVECTQMVGTIWCLRNH